METGLSCNVVNLCLIIKAHRQSICYVVKITEHVSVRYQNIWPVSILRRTYKVAPCDLDHLTKKIKVLVIRFTVKPPDSTILGTGDKPAVFRKRQYWESHRFSHCTLSYIFTLCMYCHHEWLVRWMRNVSKWNFLTSRSWFEFRSGFITWKVVFEPIDAEKVIRATRRVSGCGRGSTYYVKSFLRHNLRTWHKPSLIWRRYFANAESVNELYAGHLIPLVML